MAFAVAIVRFCRTLPHNAEGDVFRKQLLRAGTSVGANYRSSCRGRSTREKQAKLGIALEEADESDYWLTILATFDLGNTEQRQWLLKEAGELIRIFSSSLTTHRSRNRKNGSTQKLPSTS